MSWYEAAQFVNWLNTSTNHQAAYKFTGTQGTGDYALDVWSPAEAAGGTNLYRHENAKYFLPTEDEWVKAAYFNGTTLQDFATKTNGPPMKGNGVSGTGWNFYDNGHATNPYGPWNVGSGSEELNGTHDMMGNVWEWMESPHNEAAYVVDANRGTRSGSFYETAPYLKSTYRYRWGPHSEADWIGFRVASIPEPGSITLLVCGAVAGLIWRRRRRRYS